MDLISSKLTCRYCGREVGREGCSDMKDYGTIIVHMMEFCSPGLHMFGSFEELYCDAALASSLSYVILMITLHDRNSCQCMFPLTTLKACHVSTLNSHATWIKDNRLI